ncbi:MAG: arylamine N-acetyltransferase family protein [Sphingomonadales bacterium]
MADLGLRQALPVDLDAYCARIGYSGPRTPTIGTLRALHALHPAAIPFENIDVLLDRGIDIAPAPVDAKLIAGRRGGYCYEHNGLFKRVLQAIGFSVEGLAARVCWMVPPGSGPRPRTHMALRVTIDGTPWLADVGFGACVPTVPLRMDAAAPQETGHETFRVRSTGEGVRVEALVGDRWEALYDLSLEPVLDVDYELGNWFVSAHPQSHFRHVLMAGRVTPGARYTLLNGRFTVRSPGGETERRLLDADALESVLAREFGLPVQPDWRPLIERIAALGEPG